MNATAPVDALRAIVEVRWRLLESYALARQDGLHAPVGLVVDCRHAYGKKLAQRVLLASGGPSSGSVSVSCMELPTLTNMLATPAPDAAAVLRNSNDEPGRWIAVLLAERAWVLTGTWQELMMAEAPASVRGAASRRESGGSR